MDRENVKWLLIGLGALVLTITTVGIGAWLIYFGVSELDESLASRPPVASEPQVEKRLGVDIRSEREAQYFETLEAQPWLERYTQTSAEGDWYGVLYSEEDFARLEAHLSERLSSMEDGWDIREYSDMCSGLGSIRYGQEPDLMEATLLRWRTSSPESHHAWLVSGIFYKELAWMWRGSGYANTVAEEGWAKFRDYMARSRQFLERSYELNPLDPESSSNLLITARAMSLGRSERDVYFGRVMEIAQNHYAAWNNYWFSATPKWGGSWEELKAIVKQTEELKEEYPMLGLIWLRVRTEMSFTRDGYEEIFAKKKVQRKIMTLYEGLLERWPDKALLHMNYALFLSDYINDYSLAAEHFDAVGDQYYRGTVWRSLPAYNKARARTYALHGWTLEGEKRSEYVTLAYELAPHDALATVQIGWLNERLGNLEEAESYFRMSSELDPNYGSAYIALAGLYRKQGRYAEARAEADRGLKRDISRKNGMELRRIRYFAIKEMGASETSEE